MINTNKKYAIDLGGMPFTLSNCTRNQYRLIAHLSQYVDINALQTAVNLVLPRFPMYTITINKKWNSLRELEVINTNILITKYQNKFQPFNIKSTEPLFRVMYGEKFICIEMFHSLTDANGCLTFLNSILACYYEVLGQQVDKTNIINFNSECKESEFEDSFFKYAEKTKAKINPAKSLFLKSFHNKCKVLPDRQGVVITYSLNVDELKKVAKQYNATLHEYLTTILCLAVNRLKTECNNKKCVRIQMPINLRKRYPSESLRNFVATTQFDTKNTDKQTILNEFKEYLKLATCDNELKAFMQSAVSLMHGVLRFLPRFIGDFMLKTGDKILGEKANSTAFSNIGVVNTNLHINGVESYEFIEGTPLYISNLTSAISFKNVCNFTFSKNTQDEKFEHYFLEELKKDNIIPKNIMIK